MSNEDKAKLDNIAQLQNICEQTKQEGHVVVKSVINENNNNNDNNTICNGMNIRREKTRREKIEMEIKKWNKKVENQKSGIININNNNSGISNSSNHHIVIDDINSCQNNVTMNNNNNHHSDMGYDVVKLDEYKKDSNNVKGENNNSNSNNTTTLKHNVNEDYNNNNSNNITQTFICYICQRKFPSEEKLKLHESMSELHKANLEKQKKETLS